MRSIYLEKGKFVAKFFYNETLIRELRTIDGTIFSDSDTAWLIPANTLTVEEIIAFVNRNDFVVSSDAALHLKYLQTNKILLWGLINDKTETLPQINGFKKELLQHELKAVQYISICKNMLLCDEAGIEVRNTALAAIHSIKSFPCLILCRRSSIIDWHRKLDEVGINKKDYTINSGFPALMSIKSIIVDDSQMLLTREYSELLWFKKIIHDIPIKIFISQANTPLRDIAIPLMIMNRLVEFGGKARFGMLADAEPDYLIQKLKSLCYIRRTKKELVDQLQDKTIVPHYCTIQRDEYESALEDTVMMIKPIMQRMDTLSESSLSYKSCIAQVGALMSNLLDVISIWKLPLLKEWLIEYIKGGVAIIPLINHRGSRIDIEHSFRGVDTIKWQREIEIYNAVSMDVPYNHNMFTGHLNAPNTPSTNFVFVAVNTIDEFLWRKLQSPFEGESVDGWNISLLLELVELLTNKSAK